MTDIRESTDAYTPAQIAERVNNVGVAKVKLSTLQSMVLALVAGADIAFGGMFFTLVMTGTELGLGPARLLGGMAFSLGLILVVVGGAELFTGNNLIAMAWADRKVTTAQMMRNWVLVYIGNLIGSLGCVFLVYYSGALDMGSGAVAETAVKLAAGKINLPFSEALVRGILCNTLVCLAVWLCVAARSVTGKVFAIIFPISAFVALGFEHSVANMYLIPIGILASWDAGGATALSIGGALHNLAAVTVGNIIGGSVFVALIYYIVYIREASKSF